MPVGEQSALRSQLVSDRWLAELAAASGLSTVLRLGPMASGDAAGQATILAEWSESSLTNQAFNVSTSATNPTATVTHDETSGLSPLTNFDLIHLHYHHRHRRFRGWAEWHHSYPESAVPGPLPILGAGAAFGFSRKLRSRIKASA